jgi:hypothetical protein
LWLKQPRFTHNRFGYERKGRARVLLAIVAVPITFLALLCGFIVSLIMRYGPALMGSKSEIDGLKE